MNRALSSVEAITSGQGLDDKKRPCPKQGQTLPEMREFDITGFVEINGEVCRIKSVEDLLAVSAKVHAITDPTLYKNVEVFALIYNKDLFHLATLKGPVRTYDLCEYGCEGDYDLDGDEGLVSCILNDIECVLE